MLQNAPLSARNVGGNQEVSSLELLRCSRCAWVVMDSALAAGICGRLKVHIPSCLQLCSAEASWHYQGAMVAWGSGGPLPGFTNTVTIATVTSSPWGAGELAENICLPYPAFSRCSFLCCMVGVRINPRKYWVSSLLVSLPTAHNSRSICTALPLGAYHSDVL